MEELRLGKLLKDITVFILAEYHYYDHARDSDPKLFSYLLRLREGDADYNSALTVCESYVNNLIFVLRLIHKSPEEKAYKDTFLR